jgi:LmbE family N-acetylglucosaminyl deacetylase
LPVASAGHDELTVTRIRAFVWERALRVADRGFRPRLRADPAGPVLVLAPHLDDAVIDCWSVLAEPADVRVATVFTGEPPQGVLVHWDRLVRAHDSATLMRERREEDRAALALAGREPIHLPLLPDPYRPPGRRPRLREIDALVTAAVPAVSRLLAPATLAVVHPDHLVVRSYALAAAAAGVPVELYADAPYAVQYGWPGWVTGEEPDPRLDPEVAWRAGKADLPHLLTRERARVVALDDAQAAAKLAALRCYASQLPMLEGGPAGRLNHRGVHGFEVFWRV